MQTYISLRRKVKAVSTLRGALVYHHLGYQPTMAAAADLNGDGHLDVIAPVLFGNGNGTLRPPLLLNAGPRRTTPWPPT